MADDLSVEALYFFCSFFLSSGMKSVALSSIKHFFFFFFNASIPPGWFSENVGKRGKAKAAEAESAGKIHSGGGKNVESRKIKSRVSPKLAEPKLV